MPRKLRSRKTRLGETHTNDDLLYLQAAVRDARRLLTSVQNKPRQACRSRVTDLRALDAIVEHGRVHARMAKMAVPDELDQIRKAKDRLWSWFGHDCISAGKVEVT